MDFFLATPTSKPTLGVAPRPSCLHVLLSRSSDKGADICARLNDSPRCTGTGIPKNHTISWDLFRAAAAKGHFKAMYMMGLSSWFGWGTPRNCPGKPACMILQGHASGFVLLMFACLYTCACNCACAIVYVRVCALRVWTSACKFGCITLLASVYIRACMYVQ